MENSVDINDVDVFIFDFDGVLTNNLVYIDQDGRESVSCSRSDGLAFDLLRKLNKPAYILSTEENQVVSARANKLKVPVLHGVANKVVELKRLANEKSFNLARVFYIGNDINDYKVMQICGYTACPSDSHRSIKQIADFNLETKGGNGVVRELLEDVFQLNFVQILY